MLQIDNLSYWEYKSYFSDLDLIIIGAGLVGYTTAIAYKDQYPNANILILEKGYLPTGASTKNAGFACFGSPSELLADLEKDSQENVLEILEMRFKGLQKLKKIVGEKNLKYQQHGSWDLMNNESRAELIAWDEKLKFLNNLISNNLSKHNFGKKHIFEIDSEVQSTFGFKNWNIGLKNNYEGQIDTASMMLTLHQKITSIGVNVLFSTTCEEFTANKDGVVVNTNLGEIKSRKLAICTNGFAKQLLPEMDVEPARAQVLITTEIKDLKIKGTFHFDSGFYYFRNIDNRILFGGGRNLDLIGENTSEFGNTSLISDNLEHLLKENILPNTAYKIDRQWSGIMGVGQNKKPIIKKISDNVAVGVRMGGMGIAIGSNVGEELANLLKD